MIDDPFAHSEESFLSWIEHNEAINKLNIVEE